MSHQIQSDRKFQSHSIACGGHTYLLRVAELRVALAVLLDAIITPSRSRFWYMLPEYRFKVMSSAFQNMLSFENSFGWRRMTIR